jgi:hypothetical protein
MHRFLITTIVVPILFNSIHCVKYIDPPIPKAQVLLMSRPWILAYKKWETLDSLNTLSYHLLSSSDCEKQEAITFNDHLTYRVNLVCNQSTPTTLFGDWQFDPDSTLGFGSKASDTSITVGLNIAKLEVVTADSLKCIQMKSFATPDSNSLNFYEMAYSH